MAQQAFLKVLLALRRGAGPEGDSPFRAWLLLIARHCCVDLLRAPGPETVELTPSIDGVPQPPQVVEQRDQLSRTMRVLHQLPSDQRRALVARELEGRSYDEISAELGTTDGGVRQMIFRARATVRRAAAALLPFPRLLTSLRGAESASVLVGGRPDIVLGCALIAIAGSPPAQRLAEHAAPAAAQAGAAGPPAADRLGREPGTPVAFRARVTGGGTVHGSVRRRGGAAVLRGRDAARLPIAAAGAGPSGASDLSAAPIAAPSAPDAQAPSSAPASGGPAVTDTPREGAGTSGGPAPAETPSGGGSGASPVDTPRSGGSGGSGSSATDTPHGNGNVNGPSAETPRGSGNGPSAETRRGNGNGPSAETRRGNGNGNGPSTADTPRAGGSGNGPSTTDTPRAGGSGNGPSAGDTPRGNGNGPPATTGKPDTAGPPTSSAAPSAPARGNAGPGPPAAADGPSNAPADPGPPAGAGKRH